MPSMLPVLITRAGSSGVAAAFNIGTSARVSRNTPLMLTAKMLSKPDSGNSSNGAPHAAPALLNSAWMASSESASDDASVRTPSAVPRFAGIAATGPSGDSASTAAASSGSLRLDRYTLAPACNRPRAIISPIPRPPPVTTATLPSSRNQSLVMATPFVSRHARVVRPSRPPVRAGAVSRQREPAAERWAVSVDQVCRDADGIRRRDPDTRDVVVLHGVTFDGPGRRVEPHRLGHHRLGPRQRIDVRRVGVAIAEPLLHLGGQPVACGRVPRT